MAAQSATLARPDIHEMVLIHRVFRREFGLIPDLVAATTQAGKERREVLAGHLAEMLVFLHHHHTGEDELLWPKLTERATLETDLIRRMQEQHERIHELAEAAEAQYPAWRAGGTDAERDQLVATLRALLAAMTEHMDQEEKELLPVVSDHITPAEWDELGEKGFAETPKKRRMIVLGSILEDTSEAEQTEFLAKLPLIARVLWKLIGKGSYAKEVRKIRGA